MAKLTIYHTKCKLCGKKITGMTEETCQKALISHIDNECEGAKQLREWSSAGIYLEMMKIIREDELVKRLQKILKDYTVEEIRQALDLVELVKSEENG